MGEISLLVTAANRGTILLATFGVARSEKREVNSTGYSEVE